MCSRHPCKMDLPFVRKTESQVDFTALLDLLDSTVTPGAARLQSLIFDVVRRF